MKKLIFLLVIGIFLFSFVSAETSFTPIFCNDYEFSCCSEKIQPSQTEFVSDESSWVCPNYAYKCNILSKSSDSTKHYVGENNCYLYTSTFQDYWTCDNEFENNFEMKPNQHAYYRDSFNYEGSMEFQIIESHLVFCGQSGCEQGVQVSGEDYCTFNPENSIVYTSTNSLSGKEIASSYTVPTGDCVLAFQSGNRHICGYKEESCSSDLDCSGHTYGNKECTGRILQEYGCASYGQEISEKDRGPFEAGWGENENEPSQSGSADFGKRCEIISSEQVQCCGDSDCGSDMFCDTSTFTCQENAECAEDSDCGVSVQCDWTTNTLKTPLCKSGKCEYSEEQVGCCLDKNCEEGEFCNAEKNCQKSSKATIKTNTSSELGSDLSSAKQSSSGGKVILIIFLVIILGSIGFFIYVKNKNKKKPSKKKEKVDKKQSKKETLKNGFCGKCGAPLKKGSLFCSKCGNNIKEK